MARKRRSSTTSRRAQKLTPSQAAGWRAQPAVATLCVGAMMASITVVGFAMHSTLKLNEMRHATENARREAKREINTELQRFDSLVRSFEKKLDSYDMQQVKLSRLLESASHEASQIQKKKRDLWKLLSATSRAHVDSQIQRCIGIKPPAQAGTQRDQILSNIAASEEFVTGNRPTMDSNYRSAVEVFFDVFKRYVNISSESTSTKTTLLVARERVNACLQAWKDLNRPIDSDVTAFCHFVDGKIATRIGGTSELKRANHSYKRAVQLKPYNDRYSANLADNLRKLALLIEEPRERLLIIEEAIGYLKGAVDFGEQAERANLVNRNNYADLLLLKSETVRELDGDQLPMIDEAISSICVPCQSRLPIAYVTLAEGLSLRLDALYPKLTKADREALMATIREALAQAKLAGYKFNCASPEQLATSLPRLGIVENPRWIIELYRFLSSQEPNESAVGPAEFDLALLRSPSSG